MRILNQDLTYHGSPKKLRVLFLTRRSQIPNDCDWFTCKLPLMQGNLACSPAFISPFLSHPMSAATSLTSTRLGRLHSFRRDLAIPSSLVNFLPTPVKGDMRKFSTATSCYNQSKFNLQIVQTHPISFWMTLKLSKSLLGNFQCLLHSGSVRTIWNPESIQVAKAACSN